MKIVILAAMDKEVTLLLPLLSWADVMDLDGVSAHVGKIGEHDVCLLKCGIGKVNSALNAFRAVRAFGPDLVINSGVAGGADASMKVGSILVATEAAYHDVWCGPGTESGRIQGMPLRFPMDAVVVGKCRSMPGARDLRFGLIVSGDRFISTADELSHIKAAYPDALACDMESASIAQACHIMKVPFVVVRVVSDTPGQADNLSQYQNFWTEAPLRTFSAVKSLLSFL